jgi:type IV secretion system protein VirD4
MLKAFGWNRNGGEGAKGGPAAPPTALADVVADFPRGRPDGNRHEPVATARWISTEDAGRVLDPWRPGHFLLGRDAAGRYLGVSDDRHILTVSGSRAGKGVSLVTPNLLFWPGSVLAIDPKGELASLTASRRSEGGSKWSLPMTPGEGKVHALDPFQRVTGPARQFWGAFNPLADLDPNSERGLDLAWMIADALVIQSQGDGAHWTQSARSFLRGLILYVALTKKPDSRTLITVRHLLTQGREEFNLMLADMIDKGGIIGRTASALRAKPTMERGSVISTCDVHTDFLEGEPMRRVLGGSNFRMEDLKEKRVTVYLCLPATRLATHGRWLRLMVAMALEAMERTGPLEMGKPPVLFVLDEFAALGHMESIEKAAGQIAGFGVKLWPVIQDLTQLQRDYKEAWETFMGNAGVLTFFGNTDLTTAKHISERLGDTEVVRTVMNASENWQRTAGESRADFLAALSGQTQGSVNEGVNKGGGRSLSEQVMRGPLMNPNEIMQAFARDAGNLLAFVSSRRVPPLALHRCEYFSEQDDKLFGGFYDEIPGQPPPRTTAAQRETRDKSA